MSEYIFSKNAKDSEFRRLKLVEALADPISISALEHAGVAENSRCLDVGPGAGSIMRWMGARVGEKGLVLGVDRMTEYLAGLTYAPYNVKEGDILAVALQERFDVIHCRYVLIHNLNSAAILTRICERLEPGGYLVIVEPDFTSARDLNNESSAHSASLNVAICEKFADVGLDPAYGLGMPRRISDQGLAILSVEAQLHLCRGGAPAALLMAESVRAAADAYREISKVSSHDIDCYVEQAEDEERWSIYYSTVCTLARKPDL